MFISTCQAARSLNMSFSFKIYTIHRQTQGPSRKTSRDAHLPGFSRQSFTSRGKVSSYSNALMSRSSCAAAPKSKIRIAIFFKNAREMFKLKKLLRFLLPYRRKIFRLVPLSVRFFRRLCILIHAFCINPPLPCPFLGLRRQ